MEKCFASSSRERLSFFSETKYEAFLSRLQYVMRRDVWRSWTFSYRHTDAFTRLSTCDFAALRMPMRHNIKLSFIVALACTQVYDNREHLILVILMHLQDCPRMTLYLWECQRHQMRPFFHQCDFNMKIYEWQWWIFLLWNLREFLFCSRKQILSRIFPLLKPEGCLFSLMNQNWRWL